MRGLRAAIAGPIHSSTPFLRSPVFAAQRRLSHRRIIPRNLATRARITLRLRCCKELVVRLKLGTQSYGISVKTKFPPEAVAEATPPSREIGLKAFYLEPWLILGSFVLWLTVLPFAGLLWSGATLFKRIEALH